MQTCYELGDYLKLKNQFCTYFGCTEPCCIVANEFGSGDSGSGILIILGSWVRTRTDLGKNLSL